MDKEIIEKAVEKLPKEKQKDAINLLVNLPISQFDRVSERDNLINLLLEEDIAQFNSSVATFSNQNYAGGIFTDYQRELMKKVLKKSS